LGGENAAEFLTEKHEGMKYMKKAGEVLTELRNSDGINGIAEAGFGIHEIQS